ncbi:biopolymer transporter ExbD [Hydrogenophaga sp.]|uniref:ExbD/TolR family protein n=1 Tax=Hydrogenophaga sp. TaxID=1904254 RepID=UPI00271B4271|nr:biopolymer transporter ExbD [Hydrogenophaga sp.]MDO9434332.1 biopolymer transporter ExbD [Hydrogenophaga sp.]
MPAVSSRGRGRRTINEINMVPFIDVMLVLLIIFMVTAPLIAPSQIALPSVGQAGRQPDRFVAVIIDKDEQIKVREGSSSSEPQSVAMGQLVARVQQLQASRGAAPEGGVPVVISADKNVKYEAVVRVMDTLQRNGVARVGLSVQTSR